jgi:hypothetical protein
MVAVMLVESLARRYQAAPAFGEQASKLDLRKAWPVPGVQLEQQFHRCGGTACWHVTRWNTLRDIYAAKRLNLV